MCVVTTTVSALSALALAAGATMLHNQQSNQVYDYQQEIAEQEAKLAKAHAEERADAIRKKGQRRQGSTRSMLATRNVRLDEGSALDLLLDDAEQNEEEAQNALQYGAEKAWRYKSDAELSRIRQRAAQQNDVYSGISAFAGSLLS